MHVRLEVIQGVRHVNSFSLLDQNPRASQVLVAQRLVDVGLDDVDVRIIAQTKAVNDVDIVAITENRLAVPHL